jgi:hypothetical protein
VQNTYEFPRLPLGMRPERNRRMTRAQWQVFAAGIGAKWKVLSLA